MALLLYESEDSRDDLTFGAQGGGISLRFHATGTDDETEVYAGALVLSPETFYGFIRNDVSVSREGGQKYKVEVKYGTTGLGGGDVPTGAGSGGVPAPSNPTAPVSDAAALGAGYSFSTTGATVHITQSLETIDSVKRGGGAAPDFKQAIGVTKGSVEGTDIPVPSLKWSRTVTRASVDRAYVRTIKNLTGKINDATFYGSEAGTVRYLGAEGTFTTGEGWTVTHHFEENENQVDLILCDGLTIPAKGGWEYLWVSYAEELLADQVAPLPEAGFVEKVSADGNFALLEIG